MKNVLFWLLITFSGGLWGMEVKPLYQVELPTQNETKTFDQAKLIEKAFQTVLMQVAGSDKIISLPAIIEALAEPNNYVTRFSYHQRPDGERYIKVIFNENRINELFKSVHQPIWGKNRPLTLIWLVIERENIPHWVGGDSEKELVQEMEKSLNHRAIPFVFPLLDLADTSQVSEQAVINEAIEPLETAAKRYNPDIILVGRLSQKPGGWEGRWTIVKEGAKTTWDNTENELNTLLNLAAEHLSAALMGRNVEISKSDQEQQEQKVQNQFTLTISGILSAEKYNEVIAYLRRLPGVDEVDVVEVMPGKTTFSIKTGMDKENILKLIAEGRMLIENSQTGEKESLNFKASGA